MIDACARWRGRSRAKPTPVIDGQSRTMTAARHRSGNAMRSAAVGLLMAAFCSPCAAQSAPDEDWRSCVAAPTRDCILDEALRVAQSIKDDASRGWALAEIARGQANLGLRGKALELALSITVPWRRAEALSYVAEAQAREGLTKEAGVTFGQAVQAARSTGAGKVESAEALAVIAEGQAKAGFTRDAVTTFKQALQLVQSIRDKRGDFERGTVLVQVLRHIGNALAVSPEFKKEALGVFKQAEQAAPPSGSFDRVDVIAAVARAETEAGLTNEAMDLARLNHDEYWRETLLANGLKGRNPTEWATGMLKVVRDWEERDQIKLADALKTPAQFMKKKSQLDRSARDRGSLLREVVVVYSKAGMTKQALQVAESPTMLLADEWSRESALEAVARADAKAGLIEEALRLARMINDDWKRASALVDVVAAQAKAERIKEALEIAQSIGSEFRRVQSLRLVAEAMPE
jgi:tetratricopeptide (TPR) repeat protein